MDFAQSPQRTILYYPTISVPNGEWLRRALLYWDKVASIVPEEGFFARTLNAHANELIDYLSSEGVYREVYPTPVIEGPIAEDFLEEFKAVVTSEEMRKLLASRTGSNPYRGHIHRTKRTKDLMNYLDTKSLTEPHGFRALMHSLKMSQPTMAFLLKQGLIGELRWRYSRWVPIEEATALVYMSLLAKYLSYVDTDYIFTGTDLEEYLRLSYAPISGERGVECLDIHFFDILPVPREDVPLARILEFKRDENRAMELIEFRKLMDDFHKQLAEASDRREATHLLTQFRERMQKGLSDLAAQLNDARISTVTGSLSTLIQPNSRTLGSLLVGAALSVPIAASGAISGLINVGCKLIGTRNERRSELRHSPFSYLYHADKALRSR